VTARFSQPGHQPGATPRSSRSRIVRFSATNMNGMGFHLFTFQLNRSRYVHHRGLTPPNSSQQVLMLSRTLDMCKPLMDGIKGPRASTTGVNPRMSNLSRGSPNRIYPATADDEVQGASLVPRHARKSL